MKFLSLILGFPLMCLGQGSLGPAPVRVSGGVMAGYLLTKVPPVLPAEAVRQRVNGAVVLDAVIGVDGRVKDVHVVSGPEVLRASYLSAVRQWTYRHYLRDGAAVPVETVISVSVQMGAGGPE